MTKPQYESFDELAALYIRAKRDGDAEAQAEFDRRFPGLSPAHQRHLTILGPLVVARAIELRNGAIQ